MKRYIIAALTALAAAGAAQGQAAHWLATEHDFGAFGEDNGPQTARFTLVNDGPGELSIVSGRATCGCTSPTYSKASIAAGDSTIVEVTYDPQGRPGRFSKYVEIETSGQPRKTRLYVRGTVIGSGATVARRYPVDFGPLKLAQRSMLIGEVAKGKLKTVYFDGYNRTADSLSVSIAASPAWLEVVPVPEVVPAGEQVTFVAYANSAKCPLYGLVEDSISISAGGRTSVLPVTMIVNEDFSGISPDKMASAPIAALPQTIVDFGVIDRSAPGPLTAQLRIENAGKDKLLIRRVYSSDPGVQATVNTDAVKKGKAATVTVTVDPAQCRGALFNARLNIITNDPLEPVQTMRLVGTYTE